MAVTYDCVFFTYENWKLKVFLVRRGGNPFKGSWAFPGGFINNDEFTIPDLQRLYETILGTKFDRRNFQRKLCASGVISKISTKETTRDGKTSKRRPGRSGILFRFNREQYMENKEEGSKNEF